MLSLLILLLQAVFIHCGYSSNPRYDYIVVGGGTAGLVVANRLTENPHVTVAVIEAGDSVFNNPNVTDTTAFGLSLGTSIDWAYPAEPQTYALNRTLIYDSGKALGGTSTINGMTYIRPEAAHIDTWEKLGNDGWNWDSLWPYYKKSEHFQVPDAQRQDDGAAYIEDYHGFRGPVTVGWSTTLMGGDAHSILNETWQNVGLPYNADTSGGKLRGFSVWPFTLNNSVGGKGIRQDAARAYYYPFAAKRPNLHLYLNTVANKLIWDGDYYKYTATGVEVTSVGGLISNISATREVIISAGSLRTPVFLEHSGIGNPDILTKYSIPLRIALPSVGENLQDQPNNGVATSLSLNTTGYPPYVSHATAADLFGSSTSTIEANLRCSIPSYAAAVASNSNHALNASALETIFSLQADVIFHTSTPLAEILSVPIAGAPELATPFWSLLPFSRGSVHTQSKDPTAYPAIQPNFFQFEFDELAQTAIARYIRKSYTVAPLAALVGPELVPNTTTVPTDAPDEVYIEFLKSTFGPNYHPVGTAAMMSRELGGVVDSELRVYGTRNVRVVDASVFPGQVTGHLTSTIYAVAERAAEILVREGR
ncbi:putative glucose oxidase [Mytilinidion resinicola]|uniref:Glucose oxidase n=1 Tax=Mytilinidion resinicola TaxID=574789 RepID=A0A6A6Z821_9PEZI|nr:putative glucose oxidase [Mytilinidion resinicola]KAF2816873.1 putative glucose oxidase [Mytilinidion resinicola]